MSGDQKPIMVIAHRSATSIAVLLYEAMAKHGTEMFVMAKVNETNENLSRDTIIKAAIDSGIIESAGRTIAERLEADGFEVVKKQENPKVQEAKGATLRVQDKDA